MTDNPMTNDDIKIQEPRLWASDGWTTRVTVHLDIEPDDGNPTAVLWRLRWR